MGVAVSSFGATLMAVGNPSVGPTASRLAALLRQMECGAPEEAVQQPLDVTTHPLFFVQLPAAGWRVRFDAAAVVGNVALCGVLIALHFLAVRIKAVSTSSSQAQAARSLRFPAVATPVYAYFLGIIAQCAASCVARGEMVGVGLGIWGLSIASLAVAPVAIFTCCFLEHHVKPAPPQQARCSTRGAQLSHWVFAPVHEWEQAPACESTWTLTELLGTIGPVFEDYVMPARWWLTVELVTSIATNALSGVGNALPCTATGWATACLAVAYLVLVLARRPHQCRVDAASSNLAALALAVGQVATALYLSGVLVDDAPDIVSCSALVASVVVLLPLLAWPHRFVAKHLRLRRLMNHEAERTRLRLTQTLAGFEEVRRVELEAALDVLLLDDSLEGAKERWIEDAPEPRVKEEPAAAWFDLFDDENDGAPLQATNPLTTEQTVVDYY